MGNTANEIRNSVNDWLKFSRMKAQKEKAMEAKKKIFDEIPIKGTFYDSDEISLGGFLERIIGIPKIVSLKPSEPLSSNEYSKDYNRLTNVWGR
uniref:Uncharacterized protein n=1 Tax=Rhabditophanes sp. KR3021 TaxID=114890 RepID=A0AC35UA82_9BILA